MCTAVDERSMGTMVDDKTIATKVKAELIDNAGLKKAMLDFTVYCYYGKVYIVGVVESEMDSKQAVAVARGVPGVISVDTYLIAKTSSGVGRYVDDKTILAKIRSKMIGDMQITSSHFDLEVIRGNVVLLGVADSQNEINRALYHTRSVSGVRGVKVFAFSK